MRIHMLAAALVLSAAGCAQTPVYTPPFTRAAPVSLNPPVAVTLVVTYTRDGKRDPKREQELQSALAADPTVGTAFHPADAASSSGTLTIDVQDGATGNKSLFGTLSASVGHVLVAQPEFTPEGRRTARTFDVSIRYAPTGGKALEQHYAGELITVTNNTQEPTDLVPLQDRKHAEMVLIGNDLNAFAAGLAALAAPP